MKRNRGFTLIEAGIVMAIIAILAVVAGSGLRAARRNATVGSTAFDLVLRLQGLKSQALTEQKRLVAVLVNPEGGESTACGVLNPTKCLRFYVLAEPTAAWTLAAFDPSSPGANASVQDKDSLPAGIALDVGARGAAAAAPFEAVRQLATQVTASCSGRTCVAIQFDPTGEVRPEYAGSDTPSLQGIAFGLKSDMAGAGADRQAVLVSFPTGIVKSFPY